jgi:heat shock protein HtpX
MRNMRQEEVDAVLGHEIAHVANGDMVTLTLIQGVVNTFVMFLARILGGIIDRAVFKNEEGRGIGFSRYREYRADAGGAHLAGRGNMISALERLKAGAQEPLPEGLAAFGIKGGKGGGLMALFSSHPPLEDRIAALRAAQ